MHALWLYFSALVHLWNNIIYNEFRYQMKTTTSKLHFYITTPIYYVTAAPHLGSLYSTLVADVIARWHTLKGDAVFFATGTDEHGQKIAQAAHAANKTPQDFTDGLISKFQDTWQLYDIEYSKFVRTTDQYHMHGAQEFVKQLIAAGDTYQAAYEGWYCTPCETFISNPKLECEPEPLCSSCDRKVSWLTEQTVFFKLSNYQNKLLDFYRANPHFITPKERFNEVISFVQDGLKDLSLSRTSVSWGIPFPDDSVHNSVIYVWVEALCNYITAIGFGKSGKEQELNRWWPADLHVLGKDIVRFHAVYWPAMLMSIGMEPPKRLLVHGWIKVNQQKMSKSIGNVIDPIQLCQTYGADAVRYFLCRQIPINQDGEFSISDLEQRISSDLANDLGNLLNRVVTFAKALNEESNIFTELPGLELADFTGTIESQSHFDRQSNKLRYLVTSIIDEIEGYMRDGMLHLALACLFKLVKATNTYYNEFEPWKLAKTDKNATSKVLAATAHALQAIGTLLWPFMPKKMEEMLSQLGTSMNVDGRNIIMELTCNRWTSPFSLKPGEQLFKKPESHKHKKQTKAIESHSEQTIKLNSTITIEDLNKVELCVGTIISSESIPNSNKLLRLMIDFGPIGIRQILSGIAPHYSPLELLGRQALFVVNLKPRKILGLESYGMMLLAQDNNGKPQLMSPILPVAPGTHLR